MPIKNIKNKTQKFLSVVSSSTVLAATILAVAPQGNVEVSAAAKNTQGGTTTILDTAHDSFVYYYPFGNVPPATGDAPGYLELEIQEFLSGDATQYLDIWKIEELTYVTPTKDLDTITDITDYDLTTAVNTRSIDTTDAVFNYNGFVRSVLTPYRTADNGCTPNIVGSVNKGCKWDLNDLESWDADTGLCGGAVCNGLNGNYLPGSTDYTMLPLSSSPYLGTLGTENKMGAYKIYFAPKLNAPTSTLAVFQNTSGKATLKLPAGIDGSEWPLS